MLAHAVIGACWGDEGKGVVTDYLANQHDRDETVVVRFNGGAQAGHTVVTPDGRRHVHHHFGSGTLSGYPTFLSKHFIVNPIVFTEEWGELMDLGAGPPTVWVDPDAPVTTPYDMMLNQAAELARGSGRHGSCGLGINETVQRHEMFWPLTVQGLRDKAHVEAILNQIRRRWVPRRMLELGITEMSEHLMNDDIIKRWLIDVEIFLTSVRQRTWGPYWEVAIFEGAQGLRLDAFHEDFPYVTRSRTGLTNVVELADQAKVQRFDVYYVSRAYVTRHGAGPLPHEIEGLPYPDVRDDTNVVNPWQEQLRFGWLDKERHMRTVLDDMCRAAGRITAHQVVTCMDQVGDFVKLHDAMLTVDSFVPWWISLLPGDGLAFHGPTAEHAVPVPHPSRAGKLRRA